MRKIYFLIITTFIFWQVGYSQGEDCAAAVLVNPGNHSADGPATGSGYISDCLGGPDGSQNTDWYLFIPAEDGMMTITSILPSNTTQQTAVSVFTGTCGSLTCFNSADVGGGLSELANVAVTGGVSYYIQWDDFYDDAAFDWRLDLYEPGDSCTSAIAVTPGMHTAEPQTGLGFDSLCFGGPNGSQNTDWFVYTPTMDGFIGINSNLPSNNTLQTSFSLYTGTCSSLVCYESYDSNDLAELYGIPVVGGTAYYIQWDDFHGSTLFDWELEFSTMPNCDAGNIHPSLANLEQDYCTGDSVDLRTDGTEVIEAGESYVWAFIDQSDNTNVGILISDATYNSDMNADLGAGNELSPATYTVLGAVTINGQTEFCGSPGAVVATIDSIVVNVLADTDPKCLNTTSVKDEVLLEDITLYPNPSNTGFTVVLASKLDAQISYVLSNSIGRDVYSSIDEIHTGKVVKQIETSSLPNGVYFLEIGNQQRKHVEKIIIQH